MSYYGEYEKAIADCQRAIEIDPDFGNPYNDIGAYLIALGKADEAVFWLRKAAVAPRYRSRCFAFMNLGRVHLAKGQMIAALRCFETACRHNDDYEPALYMAEATRRKIH
jgi:Tfp pilus assembly protein PilF